MSLGKSIGMNNKLRELRNYEAVYDNVRIRPLAKQDIELLRLWRNDETKTKYLRQIGYITKEMQEKWYEEYIGREDDVIYAIEEIEELQTVVGSLSMYECNGTGAEIGKIQIGDERAHGKGIGRKSFLMAMLIGFQKKGLEELHLFVNAKNVAACKIYDKLGFVTGRNHPSLNGTEQYMEIDYEEFRKKNEDIPCVKIQEYTVK